MTIEELQAESCEQYEWVREMVDALPAMYISGEAAYKRWAGGAIHSQRVAAQMSQDCRKLMGIE